MFEEEGVAEEWGNLETKDTSEAGATGEEAEKTK